MKKLKVVLIILTILLASCSPPPNRELSSSLIVELSLEELAAYSDWIVIGAITGSKSSWDDERTNIFTYHIIAVEKWIKGQEKQDELEIKVPGGKVGSTTQWVENTASFQKGEEVLVFLSRNDDGTGGVVGGFQGKYIVEQGRVAGSDFSLQELISLIGDN